MLPDLIRTGRPFGSRDFPSAELGERADAQVLERRVHGQGHDDRVRPQAFGQAIGTFQHSRFLLAELVTEIEVTQTYIDRCVAEYVAGALPDIETAKAKWWAV